MASETPKIGISADLDSSVDTRGSAVQRWSLGREYTDAVQDAGGVPLVLPALAPHTAEATAAELDAVILSGGDFDVPPSMYGAAPSPRLGTLKPERTQFEVRLLAAALARKKPVLGICGGMQLLNVYFGGTLHQDLSERPDTNEHQQPTPKFEPYHRVDVTAGSLLARLAGGEQLSVNSTHHQLVQTPAPSLQCSARAPDGVIEALEWPDAPFVLGVQWHPEALGDAASRRIYAALVAAARSARSRS